MGVLVGGAGNSGFSFAHVASLTSLAYDLIVEQIVGASDTLAHLGFYLAWANVPGWALMASESHTE
jgi:hypothetical protein